MASPTRSDAPGEAAGAGSATISAVIVHHRTPEHLEAAVAALHRDARASKLGLEIIVVDNGAAEAAGGKDAAPAQLEATVLQPPRNLGFAAGINLGVRHAEGDVLLLMNADVEVAPGCLRALLDALDEADIAGPRLFWDRGFRLMLPPGQVRTRRAEFDAVLAERFPSRGRSFRRRWRRRARAFWQADRPVTCHELTGACIAVTRSGWQRTGPFDEGYRLYFEETEWLLRARQAGVRAVLAPAARSVHSYDQSAQREPRAAAWFEESSARFRRQRYGRFFARLLAGIERLPRRFEPVAPLDSPPDDDDVWVEVTPLPLGTPSTACRMTAAQAAQFEVPPDVLKGSRSDLWVRVTDQASRDLGGWLVGNSG